MPLGKASRDKLATCHTDLQMLMLAVADGIDSGDLAHAGIHDCTILEGYRGKAAQDKAVADGASESPWPTSKHNRKPSDAVDASPWPVDWDERRLDIFHAYVCGHARAMSIDLYNISWDRPHIQRNVP